MLLADCGKKAAAEAETGKARPLARIPARPIANTKPVPIENRAYSAFGDE